MEYEKTPEQLTIKKLLGSDHVDGQEPGIIKEYQGLIQRHAYDYLMVGFATDVDQVEDQREARFDAYLDKIESDFAMYRSDVTRWNQDLADNSSQDEWQVQLKEGRIIRREDLPPVDICKRAMVTSPFALNEPTREQIRVISQEGINKFFDQALDDSYELLQSRLESIAVDLPTAPLVKGGDHPKTFSELADEHSELKKRMTVLKSRIKDIPSLLLSAPYQSNDSSVKTRDELLVEHRNVRLEYSKVHSEINRIARELPNARVDDVLTRDELVSEYATVVSRMNALERLRDERNADQRHFVPGIEESHTLMDELRPVTGKLAIIGHKVLHIAGIRLQ